MITILMTLYLQWVSIVGLFESANNYQVERSRALDSIAHTYDPWMTLKDKMTQYDELIPATDTYFFKNQQLIGTTALYFDIEPGISTIEWHKNPYFSCLKCKSGQVQATMTPLGCAKNIVFDCHCEACGGKWRVKIPVIMEVIE